MKLEICYIWRIVSEEKILLMQLSDLQLSEKSGFFIFYFKLFFGIFKLFDHLKKNKQNNLLIMIQTH